MNLLENLNEVQKEIVTETEGRVLVLAGAGSGKTRVLTHRVAYLVAEKGVYGSCVLAITFTNKATLEMRERLNVLLGEDHGVWISTIHSLAARILRRFGEHIGYDKDFSIYDETDSARVINKVITELQIEDVRFRELAKEHISKAKNEGMSPEEYFYDINGLVNNADTIVKIFAKYEEHLKSNNAMDFDDLLHKLKKLLLVSDECRNYYQNKFRYIHVDEFQDTNKVQYEIIKILAEKWGNLFVVGDDDQSIYGWRGARVENILNFDKEFPNAKVFRLLENYRSTGEILDCANRVIKNNKARHKKELFTNKGKGIKVEYYSAWNDRNEAEWVVGKIESLLFYNGYRKSDFAILVRANSLTHIFEQTLQSARLNYRVIGGFRFFDRKEILDVLAYVRAVSNTRDNSAIERIINVPARGIGDATVQKLELFSRERGISLLRLLLDLELYADALPKGIAKKVESFASVMHDLNARKGMPIDDFIEYLIERVGFEEYYKSSRKEEDLNRWENLGQLVNYTKDFASSHPTFSLQEFLETVTLEETTREEEDSDNDKVTIATMHSVKGLEYRVVFIVGCAEDVFPTAKSVKSGEVEEERRIMYVAITRAKERLYISFPQRIFRFGKVQDCLASRFFLEAKGEFSNGYQLYQERKNYVNGLGDRPSFLDPEPQPSKVKNGFATKPRPVIPTPKVVKPVAKDLTGFVAGARVKHPNYGEGNIVIVIGEGANATATIAFPGLGIKKFILALAPLTLVK